MPATETESETGAPTGDAPLVEVKELSKSYGGVRALDRVSFDVREGQVVGFLGPNGAGKSTTLRILAGFLPGDSGRVTVAGHDARRESLQVRSVIGYLPEGVPIYPDMRVVEYLRFRSRLKRIPAAKRKSEIDRALEAADVTGVAKRIIGTLSRGYRQRVGLADCLLGDPRVLILDEPTVGLDPEQVLHFRGVLRDVGRDRTVILSTHILAEVEHVCSHVVIIRGGRIAARDTADRLRSVMREQVTVHAEIAGPRQDVAARLGALGQVTETAIAGEDGPIGYRRYGVVGHAGEDLRESIFEVVARNGWRLRHLERHVASLEEVFLDIVGADGFTAANG